MDQSKLKYIGFRPGVGHIYEDALGKRYIHRPAPQKTVSKTGYVDRQTGHKIHMSKKQRRRVKAMLAQMGESNGNTGT